MGEIKVRRSIHIQQPNILEDALVRSVAYVDNVKNVLMKSVSYGEQRYYYFAVRRLTLEALPYHIIYKSEDNGSTWHKFSDWNAYEQLKDKHHLLLGEPNYIVHPNGQTMLCVYRSNETIEGLLPWDEGSPEDSTGKVWYQFSFDGGRRWGKRKQMIMKGGEYDEKHWAPKIHYGQNSGCVEAVSPLYYSDCEFIVPFTSVIEGRFYSACLFGKWLQEGNDVEWSLGDYSTVGPEASNCGGTEPSVTKLPDGRLLMAMRVRTDLNDGTSSPGGQISGTQ